MSSFSFLRWFVVFIFHFMEVQTLRIVDTRWGPRDIMIIRRHTHLEAVRSTTAESMEQSPQQPPRKNSEGSKVRNWEGYTYT